MILITFFILSSKAKRVEQLKDGLRSVLEYMKEAECVSLIHNKNYMQFFQSFEKSVSLQQMHDVCLFRKFCCGCVNTHSVLQQLELLHDLFLPSDTAGFCSTACSIDKKIYVAAVQKGLGGPMDKSCMKQQ